MSGDVSKPLYLGHRERLRREVLDTLQTCPDYKLLEHLLTYALPRRDTKPLARALLERFDSLRGVLDADRTDLLEVAGLGPRTADLWECLRELRARYEEAPLRSRQRLCSSKNVAAMARARLAGQKTEEIWVALVNSGLYLLKWECVSRGSIDAAFVSAPEIIRLCLINHAWGFILVHNHPGGNGPSAQDIVITQKLEAAANTADICLLEHLIITDNNYCGLREQGFMPPLPPPGTRR